MSESLSDPKRLEANTSHFWGNLPMFFSTRKKNYPTMGPKNGLQNFGAPENCLGVFSSRKKSIQFAEGQICVCLKYPILRNIQEYNLFFNTNTWKIIQFFCSNGPKKCKNCRSLCKDVVFSKMSIKNLSSLKNMFRCQIVKLAAQQLTIRCFFVEKRKKKQWAANVAT